VDLLVPRVGELCGGSLREHRYDVLKNRLEVLKLDDSLSWYLDLRKYGGSPTGGFGMGVERLVSFLLNVPNIKDVVAFPRTPHNCQM
jgi:asparaginyl-tRNA synthetase